MSIQPQGPHQERPRNSTGRIVGGVVLVLLALVIFSQLSIWRIMGAGRALSLNSMPVFNSLLEGTLGVLFLIWGIRLFRPR